jgi:hypothetical protein
VYESDVVEVVFYSIEFIPRISDALKEHFARCLLFENVASLGIKRILCSLDR